MEYQILFEDETLLAVVKPQGTPSQADKTGDADLLSLLEDYAKQPLGLLHRLDRPVGGVMLFAKTKQAEAILAKDMQEGRLQKTYLAVLCGRLPQETGTLTDYLRKNTRINLSEVVPEGTKGGKKAILRYRRMAEKETESGWLTLAEITLLTGRHHQIRVQMAHAGAPIWGDRKYFPAFPKRGKGNIALWSYRLQGTHPKTGKDFVFVAKPSDVPFRDFIEFIEEL